jgi:GR25 family glycosyltransferase involved in LPS biosynthesis
MDYDKICYKIHSLSFNRRNTVNATKVVLDLHLNQLNSKTVSILNQEKLDQFMIEHSDFKLNLPDAIRPLKYPEVGLWASNYLAIKEFMESDYDYLILVEDDIRLNSNFYTKLEEHMSEMPSDMECFLIFKPDNIFYNRGYEALVNEESFYTSSPKIWIAHQTWSTGCMLINKSGAQKFLNYIQSGISAPIDIFIFGNQEGQYDVSSNSRVLNVYSPSKTEEKSSELHIYPTLIQNGKIIDSGN